MGTACDRRPLNHGQPADPAAGFHLDALVQPGTVAGGKSALRGLPDLSEPRARRDGWRIQRRQRRTPGRRAGLLCAGRASPTEGQSHALNKAFVESRGEIIGWINSDDAFFDCRVVEDVVDFFGRHPEVDVVYGHAAHVNADGRILHYFWTPGFSRRLLGLYDYLLQPAVFFRRRALGGRLVDESFEFAMDYELWLRLAQAARFARLDRVLAVDRVQPERKSQTLVAVARSDTRRLGEMYGVSTSTFARRLASLHHVYCRVRGARLALAAHGRVGLHRGDRRALGRLLAAGGSPQVEDAGLRSLSPTATGR